MKRIFRFSAAIALVSIMLIACKKDRVCECTYNGTVYKRTLNDATKRQAKDACTSMTIDNGNGTSSKIECELK